MAKFQTIESAPKDGTVIGIWSPREPGIVRLVRWGPHLGLKKPPHLWITVTKGIAVGNLPTHWIAVGKVPRRPAIPESARKED